jgi:hypothetical protein
MSLQRIVRHGYVFWRVPPAPPQQQLPELPDRGVDKVHGPEILSRMREAARESARARFNQEPSPQ